MFTILSKPAGRLSSNWSSGWCILMIAAVGAWAQTVPTTAYTVPTSNSQPSGIASGPDGALWFTEFTGNKIGRITTGGAFTEYAIPTGNSGPRDITTGPDGNLWFLEYFAGNVAKITTGGTVTEYPIPTPIATPISITSGPDGNLWFTENNPGKIARITTAGVVTEYPISGGSLPYGIVAGPDGALWFGQKNADTTYSVGRISTAGSFLTAFPFSTTDEPFALTNGQDGAVWMVGISGTLYRVTTAGVVTHSDPGPDFRPVSITSTPSGDLWFGTAGAAIGRITLAGVVKDFPLPPSSGSVTTVALGPDGALWFTEGTQNQIWKAVLTAPILGITKSHGNFSQGQQNATYQVAVTNFASAAGTTGTVTVQENLPPAGLTLVSMAGGGWSCSLGSCTRTDSLGAGLSYSSLTVTVNVASDAPSQVTNQVTVSGGGSESATASDTTNIAPLLTPPVLTSPANGAVGVAISPTLTWNAVSGATSYDVYLGTAANPPLLQNTTSTSLGVGPLNTGTTYNWQIVAKNAGPVTASSSIFSFTTVSGACNPSLNPGSATWPAGGGTSTVAVTDGVGCSWTANSNTPWITVNSGIPGNGNGTLTYSVQANGTGSLRNGSITIAGLTFNVTQSVANTTLRFVPVTPCRVVDTRNPTGPFGGPIIAANTSRDFVLPASNCNIPLTAAAYSLNMTVVLPGGLGFLQVWPTGSPQPGVSTLNAPDGRTKANAAIVPAGVNGAITVFASNPANVIVDINGYFVSDPNNQALAFYPITPCRVADTRNPTGTFGGPALAGNAARDFPIQLSACNVPATAQAYALNMTVVPPGPLSFMSVWPSGTSQPVVSTLNDGTGTVVANAAIVPAGGAGTNGGIRVVVTDTTHLIIDINGYFAPPGQPGALSFFPLNPCRIMDTRNPNGTFGGPILDANVSRDIPVTSSGCGVPASAKAYSLNATVVPPAGLGFLQLWNTGGAQPAVSTLNASDGFIASNAAIVPSGTGGSVTTFASNSTHLILDINGYFAP